MSSSSDHAAVAVPASSRTTSGRLALRLASETRTGACQPPCAGRKAASTSQGVVEVVIQATTVSPAALAATLGS